jgi:hypothetical protein
MTGLIVTWDEEEIQAVDEGDFEKTVVEIIENFFDAVEGYSEVTVEWETSTRNHDCLYKLERQPLVHLDRDRCFIDIVGQQQGGEYQLDLSPSGFNIKLKSTGQTWELTFLRLRDPGTAIDPENKEIFLKSIPKGIKNSLVRIVN